MRFSPNRPVATRTSLIFATPSSRQQHVAGLQVPAATQRRGYGKGINRVPFVVSYAPPTMAQRPGHVSRAEPRLKTTLRCEYKRPEIKSPETRARSSLQRALRYNQHYVVLQELDDAHPCSTLLA